MPIIESKDIIDHMIANAGHFYADDTPAKAIYRYANPDSPSRRCTRYYEAVLVS